MVNLLTGTGYLMVLGTIILLVGGTIFYVMWNKSRFRHVFRLYSTDLQSSRLIKARIKTDSTNKKYQYFFFKENNSRLEILAPHHTENGKPVRLITYDDTGDFVYLMKPTVDREKHLEYSLKPTHKTLYLQMLKDNQSKYPLLNKGLMLSYGALIIVGLMIVVGFIYTFATNVKQADQLVELSKTHQEMMSESNKISNNLVTSSNSIYSAVSLLYNGTIQRPLGSVS